MRKVEKEMVFENQMWAADIYNWHRSVLLLIQLLTQTPQADTQQNMTNFWNMSNKQIEQVEVIGNDLLR